MTPQELLRSRLIGTLFVERGLVSESQVRLALEIQQETDQQLGEILVDRFGISRAELAQVVAEQWQDSGRAAGPVLEASLSDNWRRIGEIFVTRGFVTEEELERALTRQRQTGERLGEALVGLGVISKFELAGALGEQMSTVDESETGGEVRQAEVVQLHAVPAASDETAESEGLAAVEEVAAAHDEPVSEAVAETHVEPLVEVQGRAVIEVEDWAEAHVVEIEPVAEAEPVAEIEPVEVEPVELVTEIEPVVALAPVELVAMGADPEPVWPEGEYVQPARPRPTLGAANGWRAHEPAPDLRIAACLAYVSTPAGYQVVPVGSEAPAVGAVIEIEGHGALVVVRHARSPLPHDDRTCLVVEPSAQPLVYSFA
jgi:hypothetical protein